MSSKVQRGSNRLKIALRNTAYSIAKLKGSPLNKFYKKIAFKKELQKQLQQRPENLRLLFGI